MTTHVDEVISQVSVEDEPDAGESLATASRWEQADRDRRTVDYRRRLELRTRAEGFDD